MIYASGEIPQIGDRLEDSKERQGTIVEINDSEIIIRWDEGVVGISYPSVLGFFFVQRKTVGDALH
jgi:hypothetical protein